MGTTPSTSRPQGRVSALALAAAVALGVSAFDAQALGLGRVTVQSALGEAFRADIDLTEITPEEVASLRARVASPDAFRRTGARQHAGPRLRRRRAGGRGQCGGAGLGRVLNRPDSEYRRAAPSNGPLFVG